jgi:hypothetical protein
MGVITETEAETLAVMLQHASRKMARVMDRVPGTSDYGYVWANPFPAIHDMAWAFSDIVPVEYGIYL